MLRISADTNIILSGLFFDKNPERLLTLAINGDIKLIIPDLVRDEVNEKIAEKFKNYRSIETAKELWFVLKEAFKEEKELLGDENITITCVDPDDKAILEHCVKLRIDYFISGDAKHVLVVKDAPFKIISLVDFFKTEFPQLFQEANVSKSN